MIISGQVCLTNANARCPGTLHQQLEGVMGSDGVSWDTWHSELQPAVGESISVRLTHPQQIIVSPSDFSAGLTAVSLKSELCGTSINDTSINPFIKTQ